jgi:hypothetical protein
VRRSGTSRRRTCGSISSGRQAAARRSANGKAARPEPGYEALTGRLAFYAGRVDTATVDGELVRPQPGGFYGGWVTDDVIGPIKGEPGTEGW